MQEYITPKIVIITFDSEDIITTSDSFHIIEEGPIKLPFIPADQS